MPNFKSLLKPGSSVSNNNSSKKKQQQQQQSALTTAKKSRDEKSPPRFGLFHRHSRFTGGKNSLRKSGSQSLMMCSSTLSVNGSGLSSPGIPKCNTVANFSQMGVTTVPSPPPSKCNSVSTFTGLGPSLRTSLASLSLSRCASAVGLGSSGFHRCRSCASIALSRRGSTVDVSLSESPLAFCRLCLCDVRLSEMVSLQQCSCQYCRCCLQQYLAFQVMDGNLQISCPDAACSQKGTIKQEEMESLLDDELCERYQRFLLNHEVDLDPTRVWCPKAGCETICPVPQDENTPCSVQCTTCGHKFCSQCKARWHANQTCDAYARKKAKMGPTEDEPLACYEESGSIKRCPLCRIPIERNAGCAQMMCKRCKHVFCWYCLTSLDDDFMLRHYDKGPCKNKLGHSRASLLWHRTQVVGIFAGLGVLLLVASPLLLLVAPCILCSNCKGCDLDDDVATATSTPSELISPKTV